MSIFGIPYHAVEIEIPIDGQKFKKSLENETCPSQPWLKNLHGKYKFIGKITESSFKLTPTSKGTNTYLPLIRGKYQSDGLNTKIEVIFSMHPIAIFIMFGFFSFAEYLSIKKDGNFSFVFVAAFIAFHIMMYVIGFMPEVKKVIKFIEKELAAEDNVA